MFLMNYRRMSIRLIQIGLAAVATGVIAYDALLWLPLGLDNASVLIRTLLAVSGIGAICIACGAAVMAAILPVRVCVTWGSWLVAGSMLCAIVLPLNTFIVPFVAVLASGLLMILIAAFRLATRRFGWRSSHSA